MWKRGLATWEKYRNYLQEIQELVSLYPKYRIKVILTEVYATGK